MKYIFMLITVTIFILNGCSKNVSLPQKHYVENFSSKNIQNTLSVYLQKKIPYQTLLNQDVKHIKEGDKNLYNIVITKDLKSAYDGYLSGDGDNALNALKKIATSSTDSKLLWQSSFLKIQILIMMGLGDDAVQEVSTCKRYEKLAFDSNLNCSALNAELQVWLENYDEAKEEATNVLLTIGDWEFPVSYSGPPANMPYLANIVTAQMRAYTILAALYNMQEDYTNSFYFANEAEKRYNSIFYVANHWLYGKFVNIHLDSYYGRANNLVFLATSKLALGYDKEKTQKDFKNAIDFFKMINYEKGKATVLTLKARVYNKIGEHKKCYNASNEALAFAYKHSFLDFVWRIQALKGETLLHLGQIQEAKKSYREAHDSINILTGALSKDSSKTKFGIGKDDITYQLIKFDMQDENYVQLFEDLETSRARAFVDMLSSRVLDLHRDNKILQKIVKLDKKIQKYKLLNSSNIDEKRQSKFNKMLNQRVLLAKRLQKIDSTLASTVSIYASTLKETQNSLKKEESIVYFLPLHKDEKISYLRITQKNVSLHTLQVTMNDLKKELVTLASILGIENKFATRGIKKKKLSVVGVENIKNPKSLDESINNFQKMLLVNKLFSREKTYIVASGIMHFIPWGMIDTQHEISELVNASWLNYKVLKLLGKKEIVVVANPEFHGELPQLLGAQKEGERIAALYSVKVLSGVNANVQRLYSALKEPTAILHLATHSIFYKSEPLNSAIYLSAENGAYPLTAKEIFEHPLKADLVVLSSCESGLGESISGEDMLGLARSFFLGGTKSILSSLWEVDDKGTKEFMLEFYKYAKNGKYALGYLKARATLKEKGFSPAVYGAFVLNGL